jgi:hypothetical protein
MDGLVAMRPLKVNFVPPRRVPAWVLYAVAAVLFAVAGYQGWQAWRLSRELRATEAEVAALQAKIDQARQAQREALQRLQQEPPYAKDAAAIAKVAEFPLEKVFASIESARVQGVKVTSLDVAPVEGTARAEVEFADYEALAHYLEALNAGEPAPRWTLMRTQSAGGVPNSATISSRWSD